MPSKSKEEGENSEEKSKKTKKDGDEQKEKPRWFGFYFKARPQDPSDTFCAVARVNAPKCFRKAAIGAVMPYFWDDGQWYDAQLFMIDDRKSVKEFIAKLEKWEASYEDLKLPKVTLTDFSNYKGGEETGLKKKKDDDQPSTSRKRAADKSEKEKDAVKKKRGRPKKEDSVSSASTRATSSLDASEKEEEDDDELESQNDAEVASVMGWGEGGLEESDVDDESSYDDDYTGTCDGSTPSPSIEMLEPITPE